MKHREPPKCRHCSKPAHYQGIATYEEGFTQQPVTVIEYWCETCVGLTAFLHEYKGNLDDLITPLENHPRLSSFV